MTTEIEIQADTEVYASGEGYQRTMLFTNWNPDNTRRLAKVDLRIDRIPGSSYAIGFVWTDGGWVQMIRPHTVTYWSDMPGYTRSSQDAAEVKTRLLGLKIVGMMEDLAANADF